MPYIELTQGKRTLVDAEDFDRLTRYKWHARRRPYVWYAIHSQRVPGEPHSIAMHRMILGLETGDGKQVDHVNRDGLDNRRCNLRICTKSQNAANKPSRIGVSRFKGLTWHKRHKKWYASIKVNGIWYYLGFFDSEIEAAKVYDEAAQQKFGEFACLNFP